MAQWNRNTVPKCKIKNCSDEVLATVEHIGYGGKLYRRVIKAVYFPYHHCTIDDMGWNMRDSSVPDDWEYSEEEDTWWIPQGWYEVCDYFEDYSYSEITDRVTAWMKLPKPYEPRVKEFGGKENESNN